MRRLVLLLVGLFTWNGSSAQVSDTIVIDYDNAIFLLFENSDLIFKVGIEEELLQVERFENKLVIQMGDPEFDHTNLFVECNAKVYMFVVKSGDPQQRFVYDYAKSSRSTTQTNSDSLPGREILARKVENPDSMHIEYVKAGEQLLSEKDRIFNRGIIKYRLGIYLRDIRIYDNKMFFEFEVINKSNIIYNVDFRQYRVVPTKRRIKGESFQEVLLEPIIYVNEPKEFHPKSSVKFVVVMDKFVLTNGKRMVVENWEDNGNNLNIEGGRKVEFDVFSSDLLEAINLIMEK